MIDLKKYCYDEKITFYPYKILSVSGKRFILSRSCSAIFEVDDMLLDILKYDKKSLEEMFTFLADKYTEEEILNELDDLEEQYLIKTSENYDVIDGKYNYDQFETIKINSIILMLCQECNLRCTYCYGENGEYNNKGRMSTEIGKKAIGFLFDNSGDYETINVIFFGGEPLLQKQLLKELTLYANHMAEEKNKKVDFSITTNATLINDELAEFFKDNHFRITVSIDGDKESTDVNRFYANKKGAYDDIVKGYNSIYKKIRTTARGTITKNNLDVLRSWNHLYSLDFNNIHLSHSVNLLTDESFDILIENYKKMIDVFYESIDKKEIRKIKHMGNVFSLVDRIHNGGMRIKNCGTLNNMFAVDIEGNLYPCHRFVSEEKMQVGDIYSGIDISKYIHHIKSMLLINYNSCYNCWAMNLCGGGCPQENYSMNGIVNKPYVNVCKMMKGIYEYAIEKYLTLDDEQRSWIFN